MPAQANGDCLARPRQAGHTCRPVYHAENHLKSAEQPGMRRGRWPALERSEEGRLHEVPVRPPSTRRVGGGGIEGLGGLK